MMKHVGLALTLSLAVVAMAGAQERIAVLDTELPKGMDTKVVIPITEKIMEEFVRSKLFTVLDRSFIAKTLSELEFSTSDLTAGDADKLATIGGFLKATYIVVSTVQKLDTRYFLSAKMIEVKSGVIMAQSSVDRDGSITVLIDMAGELGRKLVAAAMGQDVAAGKQGKTSTVAPPPEPTAAASGDKPSREPRTRPSRFSTVSVDGGSGIIGDLSGLSYGVSALFPAGLFYISAGASYINAETEEYYYSGEYYTDAYSDFDLYLGLGLDVPFGPVLVYAGPRASYTAVSITSYDAYYYDAGFSSYSGMGYGFELGADLRLGSFAVGVRYASLAGELMNDEDSSLADFENGTLMLRLSFAF